MTALLRSPAARRARLRRILLLLGGALAVPYTLLGSLVLGSVTHTRATVLAYGPAS